MKSLSIYFIVLINVSFLGARDELSDFSQTNLNSTSSLELISLLEENKELKLEIRNINERLEKLSLLVHGNSKQIEEQNKSYEIFTKDLRKQLDEYAEIQEEFTENTIESLKEYVDGKGESIKSYIDSLIESLHQTTNKSIDQINAYIEESFVLRVRGVLLNDKTTQQILRLLTE
jgi:hypothetical protein